MAKKTAETSSMAGNDTVLVEYEFAKETPGTWRFDAKVDKGVRVPSQSSYVEKKGKYAKKAPSKVIATFQIVS
jgi:hypothetical protein